MLAGLLFALIPMQDQVSGEHPCADKMTYLSTNM